MLKVAVPNKGTLSEPAAEMLREAGYRQRHESRDLTVLDLANDVEFFFLRPKDIAVYVGSGELDLGITGRDLAADSGAPGAGADQPRLRLLHLPLRRAGRPRLARRRPRRQADRHLVPEPGAQRPGRARHRRAGDPAGRGGGDLGAARGSPTPSPTSSTRADRCASTAWSRSAT